MNIWMGVVFSAVTMTGLQAKPAAKAEDTRRVLHASTPAYPDPMYYARKEGTFLVAVTVLPSGEVHNAVVTQSPAPYFDRLLVSHAIRWRFEPAEQTTLETLEFRFQLFPEDAPPEDLGIVFIPPLKVEIHHRRPPIATTDQPRKK
jgi:TonB family protein